MNIGASVVSKLRVAFATGLAGLNSEEVQAKLEARDGKGAFAVPTAEVVGLYRETYQRERDLLREEEEAREEWREQARVHNARLVDDGGRPNLSEFDHAQSAQISRWNAKWTALAGEYGIRATRSHDPNAGWVLLAIRERAGKLRMALSDRYQIEGEPEGLRTLRADLARLGGEIWTARDAVQRAIERRGEAHAREAAIMVEVEIRDRLEREGNQLVGRFFAEYGIESSPFGHSLERAVAEPPQVVVPIDKKRTTAGRA